MLFHVVLILKISQFFCWNISSGKNGFEWRTDLKSRFRALQDPFKIQGLIPRALTLLYRAVLKLTVDVKSLMYSLMCFLTLILSNLDSSLTILSICLRYFFDN